MLQPPTPQPPMPCGDCHAEEPCSDCVPHPPGTAPPGRVSSGGGRRGSVGNALEPVREDSDCTDGNEGCISNDNGNSANECRADVDAEAPPAPLLAPRQVWMLSRTHSCGSWRCLLEPDPPPGSDLPADRMLLDEKDSCVDGTPADLRGNESDLGYFGLRGPWPGLSAAGEAGVRNSAEMQGPTGPSELVGSGQAAGSIKAATCSDGCAAADSGCLVVGGAPSGCGVSAAERASDAAGYECSSMVSDNSAAGGGIGGGAVKSSGDILGDCGTSGCESRADGTFSERSGKQSSLVVAAAAKAASAGQRAQLRQLLQLMNEGLAKGLDVEQEKVTYTLITHIDSFTKMFLCTLFAYF